MHQGFSNSIGVVLLLPPAAAAAVGFCYKHTTLDGPVFRPINSETGGLSPSLLMLNASGDLAQLSWKLCSLMWEME